MQHQCHAIMGRGTSNISHSPYAFDSLQAGRMYIDKAM